MPSLFCLWVLCMKFCLQNFHRAVVCDVKKINICICFRWEVYFENGPSLCVGRQLCWGVELQVLLSFPGMLILVHWLSSLFGWKHIHALAWVDCCQVMGMGIKMDDFQLDCLLFICWWSSFSLYRYCQFLCLFNMHHVYKFRMLQWSTEEKETL